MPSPLKELAAALVAIDSVNPALIAGAAGERELAHFVADWCAGHGLDVELLGDGAPERRRGRTGQGGGRSLLLNGHLDTVGVAGMDAPFEPRVENGRLYGRGAYDMKGALAAILLAATSPRTCAATSSSPPSPTRSSRRSEPSRCSNGCAPTRRSSSSRRN